MFISPSGVKSHIEKMTNHLGVKVAELYAMRLHDYTRSILNLQDSLEALTERVNMHDSDIRELETEVLVLKTENETFKKVFDSLGPINTFQTG